MVGCSGTALDILKKEKALKNSSNFKSVYFNKDLTTVQIVQLKQDSDNSGKTLELSFVEISCVRNLKDSLILLFFVDLIQIVDD